MYIIIWITGWVPPVSVRLNTMQNKKSTVCIVLMKEMGKSLKTRALFSKRKVAWILLELKISFCILRVRPDYNAIC